MKKVYLKEPYISPMGNYYTAGYYTRAELPSALFKQRPELIVDKKTTDKDVIEKVEREVTLVEKLPSTVKTVNKTTKGKPTVVSLKEKQYPIEERTTNVKPTEVIKENV